jgi:transcriptional regulator with XRE-family HTH domain
MFRLKVKEVAQEKNISQRQLFLRSSVDIKIIRNIFRDPHTVVTIETLTRLAKVLGVDVSKLIESVPDKPTVIESTLDKPAVIESIPETAETKSVPDKPAKIKSAPDKSAKIESVPDKPAEVDQ